jgi:hypothetical protein
MAICKVEIHLSIVNNDSSELFGTPYSQLRYWTVLFIRSISIVALRGEAILIDEETYQSVRQRIPYRPLFRAILRGR